MEGEPSPEQYQGHKFDSARDEVLHVMSLEGWANESSGNVEAPTGYFSRISNSEDELPEVVDAFSKEIEDAELADHAALIGHFLMVENDQGFVTVRTYDSEPDVKGAYDEREQEFSAWDRGKA